MTDLERWLKETDLGRTRVTVVCANTPPVEVLAIRSLTTRLACSPDCRFRGKRLAFQSMTPCPRCQSKVRIESIPINI